MNRKTAFITAILAIVGLMVTPVIRSVNQPKVQRLADGSPLPAPTPKPPAMTTVLVADGSPLPAPTPKPPLGNV